MATRRTSRHRRGRSAATWWAAVLLLAAPALGAGPELEAPATVESRAPAPVAASAPSGDREARPLGPAGAASAAPSAAPSANRAAPTGWATQTAWALGGVLALAMGLAAVVRLAARHQPGLRAALGPGGRAPAGVLEILGRYPVGRGITLVLLKLDRRVLLLSQSAGGRFGAGAGFTTLCEIADPEEVASILVRTRDAEGESMAERFQAMLSRFDRDLDAAERADGRQVTRSASGDRVELWDPRAGVHVVDLTGHREGLLGSVAAWSGRVVSRLGLGSGGGAMR